MMKTIVTFGLVVLAVACGGEVDEEREPTSTEQEPAAVEAEEPDAGSDAGCKLGLMCAAPISQECLAALRELPCDAPAPLDVCGPCVRAKQ